VAERIVGQPPVTPRPLRALMRPLFQSAAGMSVQQRFIETISANIANAGTTRTAEGGPYRRQVTVASGTRTETYTDRTAGRQVYDPGHPDANEMGYVTMPNVDLASETVDLMVARRMHEANATVFQVAKAMLRRALEI